MKTEELIHAKRKGKGHKGNRPQQNNYAQQQRPQDSGRGAAGLAPDFEIAFKWVAVDGVRISPQENKHVYKEYNDVRAQLLRNTVYNPDGTENKEGISRLRQAGLKDKDIYEVVGKGKTPNGFNYHHLFPRALSGAFKDGAVKFGNDTLTGIHDWRALMPLPNAAGKDIHCKVHQAMEDRNGPLPEKAGKKMKYYIAMPLSAEEYEKYKENPASVKAELLIVSANSFRTVDQRDNAASKAAMMKRMISMGR